ncbi:MAG: hypothetical protein OXH40_12925 [Chloroflexi bacterium]|nr:hypothetical protein [Chloroflexota bacterium]
MTWESEAQALELSRSFRALDERGRGNNAIKDQVTSRMRDIEIKPATFREQISYLVRRSRLHPSDPLYRLMMRVSVAGDKALRRARNIWDELERGRGKIKIERGLHRSEHLYRIESGVATADWTPIQPLTELFTDHDKLKDRTGDWIFEHDRLDVALRKEQNELSQRLRDAVSMDDEVFRLATELQLWIQEFQRWLDAAERFYMNRVYRLDGDYKVNMHALEDSQPLF